MCPKRMENAAISDEDQSTFRAHHQLSQEKDRFEEH